jgi:apolipoprotein N-acyltransferase
MQAFADDSTRVTAAALTNSGLTLKLWQRAALAVSPAPLFLLALAPFNQFYIAWFALVPWMIVVSTARSKKSAAGWGYVGGLAFFGLNFWWLWHATFVGTFVLLLYLASWWAIAGVMVNLIARTKKSETQTGMSVPPIEPKLAIGNWQSAILIPAAWTTTEWFRGWLGDMFPWFSLSQTQVPLLSICQIADIAGHWGVTFWVVMANTVVLLAFHFRREFSRVFSILGIFAALTIAIVSYGLWRMNQDAFTPGPRILVIQSNFPHERGGARTATQQQQIDFHFATTTAAMNELRAKGEAVDLIAWSETVLPPMNPEVRAGAGAAKSLNEIHESLLTLVRDYNTPLLFGAYAVPKVQAKGAPANEADIRNAAYLYTPAGATQQRYDKIRLVPFGEYVWFKRSIPWLHKLMFNIAAYSVAYEISAGDLSQEIVFPLPPQDDVFKFVTPICMEDMDSAYVAKMFRSPAGKRAGFIMNITNDGWFNHFQKAGHLQAAVFRSIENRVWTARANNTGASGFIDSAGRHVQILASNSSGWAVQQLQLDQRYSFYSRFGDVFAWFCVLVTAAGLFITWRRR